MRHLTATVALMALMSSGAATWPVPAWTQELNPDELADRLGDAVDNAEGAGPLDPDALLTEDELDELVAPVALYPDALLAQVLVAATFPLQIVKADQIIEASPDLTDEGLSQEIADAELDPSVLVLLSGFPTVIERMADDIDWAEDLGAAMLEQDDDVLAAVQRMREVALDTGYLADNEAQVVEQEGETIYIEPADPEVIYVPNYDPAAAFTSVPTAAPYIVPPAQQGFSMQDVLIPGAVAFGTSLLVGELFGDDDDDDNDEGWDDYWERPRPIAWRDREFYPRPYRDNGRGWGWERDNYWNPAERRWRRDEAAFARYEERRQETIQRLRERNQSQRERLRRAAVEERREEREDERAARLRQQERREDRAAEERQLDRRQERRDERQAEELRRERQQGRREQRAVDERQELRREERREQREVEERQELRQDERRRQQAQERRQEERRQEQAQERRQEERRQEQTQEQRQEERRRQQAQERRQEERRQEATAEQRRQEQQADERRRQQRQAEQAAERQRQQQAERRQQRQAEQAAERQSQQQAERRQQRQAEQQAERRQQQRQEGAQQRQQVDCGDLGSGRERRACRQSQ